MPCGSLGMILPAQPAPVVVLIIIKSRFMTLLSHPVDKPAGLQSEGFPWSGIVCPYSGSRE